MKQKVVLIVLDGVGISPIEEGNAVLKARTPFLDVALGNFPKALLKASGEEVGLPWGEMGNSEVGHFNLGTGRITMQDLPRINKSIEDKSFFQNEYLLDVCEHVKKNKSKLHLIGLLSDGGVHAQVDHLLALLDLAKIEQVPQVVIHGITDGRDMPAKSADRVLSKVQEKLNDFSLAHLASLIGRYYAMDRDKNWDRTQSAYELMTQGKGEKIENWQKALEAGYHNGQDDEKLESFILDDKVLIENNDAIIFFNFRQDRAKQLAEVFINPDFNHFTRAKSINNLRFVSFVSYGNEQTPLVDVAYMSEKIDNQFAKVISDAKLNQLHIAETEKYAHVTYFFNGGIEKALPGEERIIIPSLKVKSYAQKPEMSAQQITKEFLGFFKKKNPDFSVINLANGDMVGHTGNLKAAINAIECVDKCLQSIVCDIVDESTSVIITSDHGNCEQMINPETKEIDKEHTTNPVPLILINSGQPVKNLLSKKITTDEKLIFFSSTPIGMLADIAPTILNGYFGVNQPKIMTGFNLKDSI